MTLVRAKEIQELWDRSALEHLEAGRPSYPPPNEREVDEINRVFLAMPKTSRRYDALKNIIARGDGIDV